jgi:TonB family protein
MNFYASKRLLTLAVFMCTAMPSFAFEQAPIDTTTCKKPGYPPQALAAEQEGVSVIGFFVGPDGKVMRSVVLNSSGSADLDSATARALSKCTFRLARDGGEAAERWVRMTYTWSFEDDPEGRGAMRKAALAARKGDLDALYQFSLLLMASAKTDADREKATTVLHSAAEQGHAHAQYHLGWRYEKGIEVEANLEEALRWYQKSAAQGDPLAMQRLALGRLTD